MLDCDLQGPWGRFTNMTEPSICNTDNTRLSCTFIIITFFSGYTFSCFIFLSNFVWNINLIWTTFYAIFSFSLCFCHLCFVFFLGFIFFKKPAKHEPRLFFLNECTNNCNLTCKNVIEKPPKKLNKFCCESYIKFPVFPKIKRIKMRFFMRYFWIFFFVFGEWMMSCLDRKGEVFRWRRLVLFHWKL